MKSLETPVLIVGGGPTGMMASLLLHRLGVDNRIVERRAVSQRAPAAHVINARTLEICRAAGVDMQALAAAAADPADAGRVYWVDKLGGRVFGYQPYERQGDDQLALTPTPLRNISQHRFEPALLNALDAAGAPQPLWSHQWESATQDAEGVVSTIRDRQTDQPSEIRSRFLIAADGAGSRVRKSLGIEMTGPAQIQTFVMIHVRADLRRLAGEPPGILHFVCDPQASGAFVLHDLDHESVFMHAIDPAVESVEQYDAARCEAIVRQAMHDPDVDLEVETISTWTMTSQVADRYRDRRIFLAGDAAHRFPPTGGLGLNSGVQDAHNLAWKLAGVLAGWAGDPLLETYEAERRPVAQQNAEQSLANALRLIEVPLAMGLSEDVEASRAELERVWADPARRQAVESAIDGQAEHFDMPGLQLGFRYQTGVVCSDGTASDPHAVREFVPSGRPGARLPHAWTRDGGSVLDWVPLDRFILLVGPDGDSWSDAVGQVGRIPLVFKQLEQGELRDSETWLAACGISRDGALLVRPDQHIAWRSSDCSDAAARLARCVDSLPIE